jgi:hypothetical protein
MNMAKLQEILSLIASVGVIASIIFLGIEMQQNTDMMQSQTRNSIVENQLSFYESITDNPQLAVIMTELRKDADFYASGSPERTRYHFFVMSQLRMWENEWYQYQKGLFDQKEFDSRVNTWKTNIAVPINAIIWTNIRGAFSEDFRDYLNAIMESET